MARGSNVARLVMRPLSQMQPVLERRLEGTVIVSEPQVSSADATYTNRNAPPAWTNPDFGTRQIQDRLQDLPLPFFDRNQLSPPVHMEMLKRHWRVREAVRLVRRGMLGSPCVRTGGRWIRRWCGRGTWWGCGCRLSRRFCRVVQ